MCICLCRGNGGGDGRGVESCEWVGKLSLSFSSDRPVSKES